MSVVGLYDLSTKVDAIEMDAGYDSCRMAVWCTCSVSRHHDIELVTLNSPL